MIYYFSGTGNSQWVAERVAQALGDKAVNIVGLSEAEYRFGEGDQVGLVFPAYAWAAPELVAEFAQRIRPNGAFTFAVCTCGGSVGRTMEALSKALPLDAGYSVVMPDNYIVGDYEEETEEEVREKLAAVGARVDEIVAALKAKQKGFDVTVGPEPDYRTYERSPNFNKNKRKTEPFCVTDEKCTSCGLCEEVCPAGVVKLQNGKPVWTKPDCYLCLACLNRCPEAAIEYGTATVGKRRYVFPGV